MNILKNKNKPKANRKHNPINGHDAEVLAKSKFILALSGELNSTSRVLDNDKLDFNINFLHPWRKEQLIQFCQVKSGKAYGYEVNQESYEIKKGLIEELKKDTKSNCLIWVNRETNNLYWVYIHSKSTSVRTNFSNQHKVTPATRFDLARCFEKLNQSNFSFKGARGITIKTLKKNYIENRNYAKNKYKTLQNSKIFNPVLGQIHCTNLGWKHISRRNRKKEFKNSSFNTVSYLQNIMSSTPNSIAILNCTYDNQNNYTWRNAEYILKYKEALLSSNLSGIYRKLKITIIVRVIETIVYPKNWKNESQLSQMISRKVTLKSFYYKEEKEIS
ncbi:hypothetical protein [uncultured Maribacter sp.]|uniref:hypothetical protein n=1 Tax=uncultured Maribacter sp. TaxID=431308 RepID=UPI00262B2D6C|nr:hypothetical protein [uncultured Maribacter sp.]